MNAARVGATAQETVVTTPTHPTALPTWSWATTTEANETTTAERKANATPCTMRNTPIQNTLDTAAQPNAATVNRAAARTSSVVLLSLSAIHPVNGRMASAADATSPATNPPTASDDPSSTT